jgi:predicted transcriptional regulator
VTKLGEESLTLKSEKRENLGKRILSEVLLEKGHNSYAIAEDANMSARTVKRCTQQMKTMGLLEAIGQVKNTNRSTNFENIRKYFISLINASLLAPMAFPPELLLWIFSTNSKANINF